MSLNEQTEVCVFFEKKFSTILRSCSFASSLSLILAILVSSMCCWWLANSMMRLFSASICSCSMRLHSACCLLNSSMCCWVALTFSIFSCLSLQENNIIFQLIHYALMFSVEKMVASRHFIWHADIQWTSSTQLNLNPLNSSQVFAHANILTVIWSEKNILVCIVTHIWSSS